LPEKKYFGKKKLVLSYIKEIFLASEITFGEQGNSIKV